MKKETILAGFLSFFASALVALRFAGDVTMGAQLGSLFWGILISYLGTIVLSFLSYLIVVESFCRTPPREEPREDRQRQGGCCADKHDVLKFFFCYSPSLLGLFGIWFSSQLVSNLGPGTTTAGTMVGQVVSTYLLECHINGFFEGKTRSEILDKLRKNRARRKIELISVVIVSVGAVVFLGFGIWHEGRETIESGNFIKFLWLIGTLVPGCAFFLLRVSTKWLSRRREFTYAWLRRKRNTKDAVIEPKLQMTLAYGIGSSVGALIFALAYEPTPKFESLEPIDGWKFVGGVQVFLTVITGAWASDEKVLGELATTAISVFGQVGGAFALDFCPDVNGKLERIAETERRDPTQAEIMVRAAGVLLIAFGGALPWFCKRQFQDVLERGATSHTVLQRGATSHTQAGERLEQPIGKAAQDLEEDPVGESSSEHSAGTLADV